MTKKVYKVYGEFLCSKCGTITFQQFYVDNKENIPQLHITCECGAEVEQYIPLSMRSIIISLAKKGYKIRMINEPTLGIVLNHKLNIEDKSFPKLPYEFTYNTTEPEGDIICNERMQVGDFEGLNKDTYIKEAIENLLDWTTQLPTIDNGKYVKKKEIISLIKEEDTDDKNGSI